MADFKKIQDHPEFQKIVDKLLMGDSPKDVSAYLKHKYDKPDENHLRLSASLLDQFLKTYLNTSDFMDKIVKEEKGGALDGTIAKSLLNTKAWRDRLAEYTDDKIDIEKRIAQQITLLEQRQEQVFDKIQENPGSVKLDYVMTKYFELNAMLLEKADKIINKAPDMRVEHTYTVQMVEQQAVALQEAIKRVIARLEPEMASVFMDMLSEEMGKLKSPADVPVMTPEKSKKEVSKIEKDIEGIDSEFGEFE